MKIIASGQNLEVLDCITSTKLYQVGFIGDEINRIKDSLTGGDSKHYTDVIEDLKDKVLEDLKDKAVKKAADMISDIRITSDILVVKNDVIIKVEGQANCLVKEGGNNE